MEETHWKCPACEEANSDVYALTTCPLCGSCDRDFTWEELFTTEQIAALNSQLAPQYAVRANAITKEIE